YTYFNSSSAKFIFDLVFLLSQIIKDGVPLKIYWYFDEDDEEMKEVGEELAEVAKTNLNFVEVSH
ncbi:MAG TPA: SiaC family regulatory phosphoprotein, partial [Perlabentimonas sp.]|nr:SiaC family regulatory phosphoprotein [Perlabentimonas sp.]